MPPAVPSLASLCVGALKPALASLLADAEACSLLPLLPSCARTELLAHYRCCSLLPRRADGGGDDRDGDSGGDDDVAVAALGDALPCLRLSGLRVGAAALASLDLATTRELDVQGCGRLSGDALEAALRRSPRLAVLRWGGCRRSDAAARAALPSLLPRLSRGRGEEAAGEEEEEGTEEDAGGGWEAAAARLAPSCAAPGLRALHWPSADGASRDALAAGCPRIRLRPSPQPHPLLLSRQPAPPPPPAYVPPHSRAPHPACRGGGGEAAAERKRGKNARRAARLHGAAGSSSASPAAAAAARAAAAAADEALLARPRGRLRG